MKLKALNSKTETLVMKECNIQKCKKAFNKKGQARQAVADRVHVLRDPLGEGLFGVVRHLGRLEEDGIPSSDRSDQWEESEVDWEVPRSGDEHHPKGLAHDVRRVARH